MVLLLGKFEIWDSIIDAYLSETELKVTISNLT